MLQREHSAILSTFIKLPFVIKFLVLSNFESPLKTGFTVLENKIINILLTGRNGCILSGGHLNLGPKFNLT